MAPAEKFGLGGKFEAQTYTILSRIKICRDLRTFWRSLGKKVPFLVKNSVSWARSEITDLEFQNHKNVKNVLSAHSNKLGQIYIQWDAKLKF